MVQYKVAHRTYCHDPIVLTLQIQSVEHVNRVTILPIRIFH